MKVLLDTNIIIHRETARVINEDIGKLFGWIDRLGYQKVVHPLSQEEINQYKNPDIVKSFNTKLDSYYLLRTLAPDTPSIQKIRLKDVTRNDEIDTSLLNELHNDRVEYLITEDRGIHQKSKILGINNRVFTIDAFLEKVYAENPALVDYKVLAVKKDHFGNINLEDNFFETLKTDYDGFEAWFNKKSDEIAYICHEGNQLTAFLYVKVEDERENYRDITPTFESKKRLKVGTFKVTANGFKLGERFLKIIFDNALQYNVDEIYVTIFDHTEDQRRLIGLLYDWGFEFHGFKNATEHVLIKNFRPLPNHIEPKKTYPFIDENRRYFLNPIWPDYHTELFPDSILKTESPENFEENEPHRNAIQKVYISRSIYRDLKAGDIIIFYRTGGYYQSVITTIGVVDSTVHNIENETKFISLCRKRSVFDDAELKKWWNYNPSNRPFIINFLYLYSFPVRLNLARLIELGIIRDKDSAPRGFVRIPKEHFALIMRESESNASFIIN